MKFLSDLPRNSRNCIIIEPMWAIFGGMIFFYAPLYMKSIGLTEIQMGLINTINLLFAFGFHFIAGPITNRLGRKKTTLIFDLISWGIPMLIWAIAQNFWYFLVAYIINASVRVVGVSWFCLISEDAPENKRSRVFGLIYIINYATGIFTPVTGYLIAKYGNVPTLRVLYLVGFVSMVSMFLIRNNFISETKAGLEVMEKHNTLTLSESMKSYLKNIAGIRKNKTLMQLTLIMVISNFCVSLNFFQVIFIKEHLGFDEKTLSSTPFISAVINLLLYIYVLPRLSRFKDENLLFGAFIIMCLGAVVFLLSPAGILAILLISIALLAVGGFIMQMYRDAVFMNRVGEHEKADIYAAAQTVTTLICIPSGYIGGLLYSISPQMPFITILLLYMIAVIISFRMTIVKGKPQ